MVSIFSFGFKNRSSTSCFYFCLSCLWCLVACDQPEPIEPPSFPYDQATIEEAVLSPTGDLLTLDPERVGALVVATASVEGQSAQLFMDSILDILDSVSMLEETSEQGLTVVQHALHGESPLRRVRHAIACRTRLSGLSPCKACWTTVKPCSDVSSSIETESRMSRILSMKSWALCPSTEAVATTKAPTRSGSRVSKSPVGDKTASSMVAWSYGNEGGSMGSG